MYSISACLFFFVSLFLLSNLQPTNFASVCVLAGRSKPPGRMGWRTWMRVYRALATTLTAGSNHARGVVVVLKFCLFVPFVELPKRLF